MSCNHVMGPWLAIGVATLYMYTSIQHHTLQYYTPYQSTLTHVLSKTILAQYCLPWSKIRCQTRNAIARRTQGNPRWAPSASDKAAIDGCNQSALLLGFYPTFSSFSKTLILSCFLFTVQTHLYYTHTSHWQLISWEVLERMKGEEKNTSGEYILISD